MAKKNSKTRDVILIELLNKATPSGKAMPNGEVEEQVDEIKRFVRKNNWQGKFSRLLAKNPDWVKLAEEGKVYYIIDKDGREKGVFPVIRNNSPMLRVVM